MKDEQEKQSEPRMLSDIAPVALSLVSEEYLVGSATRFAKIVLDEETARAFNDHLRDATISTFALTPEEIGAIDTNMPMSDRAAFLRNILPGIPIIPASPLSITTNEINETTEVWHGFGASFTTQATTQSSSSTLTDADLEAVVDQLRADDFMGLPCFVISPYVAEHWDEWERKAHAQWRREWPKRRSEERKLHKLRLRIRRKRRAIARRRRRGLAIR